MVVNKRIRACVNCGSRDIRQAKLDDGIVPGYTELTKWVCNRCGHQGPEMLFDDEEARSAYENVRIDEGALKG